MTRAVAVALAVALAGCGSAPHCPGAAPRAGGAPFLWRAHRGDGPSVWLLGTIHDAAPSLVPPGAWAALADAPEVVTELGAAEPDPDALARAVELPPGKGLDQLLPADAWYDLRDALRDRVKEAALARYRPWYAMSRLTAALAPPPSPSMDAAIVARARARHVEVGALETWDEQLAALVAGVSIEDLLQAIRARRAVVCEVAALHAGYAAGDDATMLQLLAPRDREHLLAARNRRWLPALDALAARRGGFVAVGLGHLLGPDGLVAALAAAGYQVERAPR